VTAICDEGDGLTLCEQLSQKVMTALIVCVMSNIVVVENISLQFHR
jgi:hypothetical protein